MIYQLIIIVISSIFLSLEILTQQNYILDVTVGTIIAWELTNVISNKVTTAKLSKDIEYIKEMIAEIQAKLKG